MAQSSEEKKSVRDIPVDTKVGEGEGGGSPGSRVEIPLQSVKETTVKQ